MYPALTIDKFYVSSEIAALFASTIEECKKKVIADSLARVEKVASECNRLMLDSIRIDRSRRNSITMAVIAYPLALACGGIALYQYIQTDRLYNDFKHAAASGDLPTYNRLKQQISEGDILTLAACAGTLLLGACGTYFIATMPKFNQTKHQFTIVPTASRSDYGFSLLTQF